MGRLIDLAGQRFERWVVICRGKFDGRTTHWKCRCDCGTERDVAALNLTRGKSKSCGCIRSEYVKQMHKIGAVEGLISVYKRSARLRGLGFRLTKEEFKAIIRQPCHYCGDKPRRIFHKSKYTPPMKYNGIDRVDNSIGYLPENCVPCCKTCNKMKMAMSRNDFVEHIIKIYHEQVGSSHSMAGNSRVYTWGGES